MAPALLGDFRSVGDLGRACTQALVSVLDGLVRSVSRSLVIPCSIGAANEPGTVFKGPNRLGRSVRLLSDVMAPKADNIPLSGAPHQM
jgi:hypothetical protein